MQLNHEKLEVYQTAIEFLAFVCSVERYGKNFGSVFITNRTNLRMTRIDFMTIPFGQFVHSENS